MSEEQLLAACRRISPDFRLAERDGLVLATGTLGGEARELAVLRGPSPAATRRLVLETAYVQLWEARA